MVRKNAHLQVNPQKSTQNAVNFSFIQACDKHSSSNSTCVLVYFFNSQSQPVFPLSTNKKSLLLAFWFAHSNFSSSHWSTPGREHPAPWGRTSCLHSHLSIITLSLSTSTDQNPTKTNVFKTNPTVDKAPLPRQPSLAIGVRPAVTCCRMERELAATW